MMIHCNIKESSMLHQQQILGRRFGTSKMHLSPSGLGCCPFSGGGSVVHDSLMRFCNCSMLLCVHSSFAIILMGKRELVALLCLSSWYLMIVVWLFLTMPRFFFCNCGIS